MDADGPVAIRDFCPFRLVVDEDLEQLDREVTTSVAAVGTTLFEEGDPAGGVAAVLEGSVEVVTGGRVIATPGPGALLGELSVFLPRASRTATARASSPVRMVTWRAADVRNRLARHDRLATAIVADMAVALAERLDRRTQDLVALAAVHSATRRAALPAGAAAPGRRPRPGRHPRTRSPRRRPGA